MGSYLKQCFRELSPIEEAEYRKQARLSWKANQCHFKEYVHPVIEDEWNKLDEELALVKQLIAEWDKSRRNKISELNKRMDALPWYKQFW